MDIENNESLNMLVTLCFGDRIIHHPHSKNWVYSVLIWTTSM